MKRAVTLIELLVVIATIAILSAILFPVFAQAKQTQCASNERNLSIAMQLYMADYDDRFSLAAYGTETSFLLWHDLLDPYVKNKLILMCPGSQLAERDLAGGPGQP